jgi:hypothetical protein
MSHAREKRASRAEPSVTLLWLPLARERRYPPERAAPRRSLISQAGGRTIVRDANVLLTGNLSVLLQRTQ